MEVSYESGRTNSWLPTLPAAIVLSGTLYWFFTYFI